MAYDDWDPELQSLFIDTIYQSYVTGDPDDLYAAEMLFELGWVTMPAGTPTHDTRQTFFDLTGTETEDFDWYSWREYWGYEQTNVF